MEVGLFASREVQMLADRRSSELENDETCQADSSVNERLRDESEIGLLSHGMRRLRG